MPRGDKTGPSGCGPRSGRAAGYCAGYGAPGYLTAGPEAGWQRGQGFGRRRCNRGFGGSLTYGPPNTPGPVYPKSYPQPEEENVKMSLLDEARVLKERLLMLEKRIKDLDTENKNNENTD